MIIPGTTYAGRALNLIGDLDAPELMTIEEVAGNVLIDGIDEPSGSVFAPLLREITSSTIALAELELSGDLSLVGSTIALEKPLRCRNLQLHNSTLTQRATNLVRDFALRVEAETIVVAADSTVDVSGKGYLPGRTVGNIAPPNAVYFGGSYGGLGASYPTVDAVMPTYGSFARPEHLGSGSGQVDGGSGGGLVTIVADSLFLDGTILANGDAGPNKKSGGSGGGILVEVGELRGEGSLQAIGGEVRFYDHYNGGGGRIAVYYDSSADFSGTFSAHGGLAYNWHGGAGTVYVQDRAEPYGTLILTLAAVSVEVVILVVLLMGEPNPTLARDTVFAAVMFDINGILGLAAIVGGLKHGQTKYNISSANSFVAMLLVAIGVGMFIPDFVPDEKWHIYSVFSVVVMVVMYAAFLRLQTVEHRKFFEYSSVTEEEAHDEVHSPNSLHVGIMVGAIVLVGLLSEVLSVLLDAGLTGSSLPKAIPAVLVALISASPEILTALKAAQQNRMQTTVNIALGASLATVLLTLPVIEAIALFTGERIEMALTPVQAGMLLLTFLAVMNNLHDGETNAIEGISHFALFAAFIALVTMGLV